MICISSLLIAPFVNAQTYPDEELPITPYEIIERIKDAPQLLEWSKNKHFTISGPYFWGTHHLFIDGNLKHVLILLKDDLTTHVFVGHPTGANIWEKYDKNLNILFSKTISNDSVEWKFYRDIALYKGKLLPPKENGDEPYWGWVINTERYEGHLNTNSIKKLIRKLYSIK